MRLRHLAHGRGACAGTVWQRSDTWARDGSLRPTPCPCALFTEPKE